jgi:hypothetical protein
MRKFVGLACVVLAISIGCGQDNKLTTGQVEKMEYDDMDVSVTVSQSCTGYDSGGVCNSWISVPHTTIDPEHWKLKIIGTYVDGDGKTKTRSEWHTVDAREYRTCTYGDHWEVGKGCTIG